MLDLKTIIILALVVFVASALGSRVGNKVLSQMRYDDTEETKNENE